MDKTKIVQAATRYATMQNTLPGYDPAIRKAFIEGAEFVLTSQWVSIDELLPDPDTMCLVSGWEDLDFNGRLTRYTMMAWYDGEDFYDAYNDRKYHPTMWMAIPAIPQLNPEKEER